jgi:ABC-type transporter Mla MlaB component
MFVGEAPYRLRMTGFLTIQTIDDISSQLRQALDESAAFGIDCADAAEVDVGVTQLLLAARDRRQAK